MSIATNIQLLLTHKVVHTALQPPKRMTKSKYFCSTCHRGFKDKCDLGRHLNRKTPCTAKQTASYVCMITNPLFEELLEDAEGDNVAAYSHSLRSDPCSDATLSGVALSSLTSGTSTASVSSDASCPGGNSTFSNFSVSSTCLGSGTSGSSSR